MYMSVSVYDSRCIPSVDCFLHHKSDTILWLNGAVKICALHTTGVVTPVCVCVFRRELQKYVYETCFAKAKDGPVMSKALNRLA